MGKKQLLAEILKLPPSERQTLIYDAIDSLPEHYVIDPTMTPELRKELDRRYQDFLLHPERGSTWEEVSTRLKARKKRKT